MSHPEDLVVAANTINNPPLGFFHYHIGALHPYFPEIEKPTDVHSKWRPSEHPLWVGPDDFNWPLDKAPPYKKHRWLRVQDDTFIDRTPVDNLKYEFWGDSHSNWAIGAQMLYSLLENIENDAVDVYKFDKPWVMGEDRMRINFICVYSDDILDTDIENWPKDKSDEDMIAMVLPKELHRRKLDLYHFHI